MSTCRSLFCNLVNFCCDLVKDECKHAWASSCSRRLLVGQCPTQLGVDCYWLGRSMDHRSIKASMIWSNQDHRVFTEQHCSASCICSAVNAFSIWCFTFGLALMDMFNDMLPPFSCRTSFLVVCRVRTTLTIWFSLNCHPVVQRCPWSSSQCGVELSQLSQFHYITQ